MNIIAPSFKILSHINGEEILKHLELCGRVSYKSEDKIDDGTDKKFIKNIISRGHESVLEHYSFTVKFICDRGISNEIVRHRIASYTQESTRYCNYGIDKFNNSITVIKPRFFIEGTSEYNTWIEAMKSCERAYFRLIDLGATPEEARDVLPTSLKTEIVMTANIREWRHFLKLRTDSHAHPQIRELAIPLLKELQRQIPVCFDDISPE